MKRTTRGLLLCPFAASLCCAQVAPQEGLEEILVTAQRREQRPQDVPISLSVFSTDELERRQIDDIDALQFAAPNLVVASNMTSRNAAAIAMRGQFERDAAPTVDPAVGLYIDGVYFARTTGANLRMIDVARVEVLRGPQGTLFGRNTVGGAINVIPHRPGPGLEGFASASFGNYNRRDLTGVINFPLYESSSAIRLTAAHTEHEGFATSTLTGGEIADDDTNFLRGQLRITTGGNWDLNLSFDHTDSQSGSQWLTLAAVFPPALPIPGAMGNPGDSLTNYVHPHADRLPVRSGRARAQTWGSSAAFSAQWEHLTFKSISAFRGLNIDSTDSDQDGTPYDISTILERHDEQDQFSQELQLYGTAFDARLDWIGGLYYFLEHGTFTQRFPILAPPAFDPLEMTPWGEVRNESLAAYAQATYSFTPTLRVTGGLRYNTDGRQLTSRNSQLRRGVRTCRLNPAVLDDPAICEATLPERNFEYVPYAFAVEYEPRDTLLFYGRLSRGQRAGGYNLRGATLLDFDPFDPEEVVAYELGSKAELFSNRLSLRLAVFRSDFEDIQLTARVLDPGIPLGLSAIRNGGEARIQGGELELTALLGSLQVAASLGITDAEYTNIDPGATDIRPGSTFLMTPRTTAALSLDLPLRLPFGELRLHADYGWRDDISFWYEPSSLARQESYGILNATVAVRLGDSGVEVGLWGRNLADTRYFTRAFESASLVAGIPGDPRTFGASFTYRFSRAAP